MPFLPLSPAQPTHQAEITDGETGLLVSSAAGFEAAIARLIDDPALAQRIGVAAQAKVAPPSP